MTKEEALEQLRLGPGINEDVSEEYNDAVDMAIKALEQQPSEDCVSRQAVLDKAELIELEDGQTFYCISPEDVKALPSVKPTRKSGLHWIERFDDTDKWLECPSCHKDSDNAYAYCPNCGASFKEKKRGNENGI